MEPITITLTNDGPETDNRETAYRATTTVNGQSYEATRAQTPWDALTDVVRDITAANTPSWNRRND